MNKWTKVLGVVAATAMFIPLAACGGSRGTTTAGGDGGSSDTVKVVFRCLSRCSSVGRSMART